MLNNTEDKGNSWWSFEIGFYPGVLLGFRKYEFYDSSLYVIYLPFVDLSLEINN